MSKHLSLVVVALFCVLYRIEASSKEVKNKFRDEEIAPDVLEAIPELDLLKISYPSGMNVNLGNVLTPTQVKDQPKVEWEGEDDAFYTLLMTGTSEGEIASIILNLRLSLKIPTRRRAKNPREENSGTG